MAFTEEELAAMAAADAQIEEEFDGITPEEMELSDALDAEAGQKKAYNADRWKRYYLRNREKILERERAYRMDPANRDRLMKIAHRKYLAKKAFYLEHGRRHKEMVCRTKPIAEFGARLRAARRARGLSARKLGEMLGVPGKTIYENEHGMRMKPNRKLAEWLAMEETNDGRMDRIQDEGADAGGAGEVAGREAHLGEQDAEGAGRGADLR